MCCYLLHLPLLPHAWYDNGTTWQRSVITAEPCNSGARLAPRGNGYSVAVVAHEFRPYYDDDHHPVTMGEQVIVMGGSDDTAVWLSEDGGSTFTCQDRPQPWEPLDFPSVFDLAFTDTWWMAGGVIRTVPPGSFVGIFVTRDREANFSRPQCASTCPNPYNNSWLLPTIGPIAIGNRGAAYQWDVPGFGVYTLSNDTVGIGFTRLQGAVSGGYGRKVFIKADPFSGAGCWVSVDYTPSDLWAGATTPWGLNSTNGIAIAEHAEGPRTEVGPAPWEPRAAAALVTEELAAGKLSLHRGWDLRMELPTVRRLAMCGASMSACVW